MALTLEQEKALLALLHEKRTTLPELSPTTELMGSDLFLTSQMLADKSVTADVMKQFIAPDATLSRKGVVQLSNQVNSESETQAATPKAVKQAYDLANSKVNSVNGKKGTVTLTPDDIGAYSTNAVDGKLNELTQNVDNQFNELSNNFTSKNIHATETLALKGQTVITSINSVGADSNGNIEVNVLPPLEFGAVGTDCLCARTTSKQWVMPGEIIAGSEISPTGICFKPTEYYVQYDVYPTSSTALTGTWRCMGYTWNGNSNVTTAISLFKRIL